MLEVGEMDARLQELLIPSTKYKKIRLSKCKMSPSSPLSLSLINSKYCDYLL